MPGMRPAPTARKPKRWPDRAQEMRRRRQTQRWSAPPLRASNEPTFPNLTCGISLMLSKNDYKYLIHYIMYVVKNFLRPYKTCLHLWVGPERIGRIDAWRLPDWQSRPMSGPVRC